jgi:hypothetical protein
MDAWRIILPMAMPSPATETDREVLAGIVERVTFHDAEIGQRLGLQFKARFRSGAPGGNADNWPERVAALDPSRSLKQPGAVTGTGLSSPISIYGFAKMSVIPRATVDVSEAGVAADDPIAGMSYAVSTLRAPIG